MKEFDNNIQTLFKELTNITINITTKEMCYDDINNPIIDEESGIVVGFPKLWDFILTFNNDFKVDGNNQNDIDQDMNLEYYKFMVEIKLNAYREIDNLVTSKDSLLKKKNYLCSIKSHFVELLPNYFFITDNKYSSLYGLLDNKIIQRSIPQQKSIKYLFEKKLANSFLVVQKNAIETLIQFIDEKLQILSTTEDDSIGKPVNASSTLSDPIAQLDPYQTTSHEIVTKSFYWNRKEQFKTDILKLFTLLTLSDIIPRNTDFNNFSNAFSGKSVFEPLRIKWLIVGKNKQTSKASLFHFISKLEDFKLIENKDWHGKNYMPLYQKIAVIFIDKDDQIFTIEGLKSSRSQGLRSDCAKQSEIDEIIMNVVNSISAKLPE